MYRGKFERTPAPADTGKAPRLGSLMFYLLFFLSLLLFWLGVYLGLDALNVWLCNYEAAQPDTVCRDVFEALFAEPDWGELYDRAEQEEGLWEGKDAFVNAMEEKAGGQPLTYLKTSAGLSGDVKYIVNLGGEEIAAFTLTDHATQEQGLPDWRLGSVEFYIQGSESYQIRCPQSCRVFVNGRELGDDQIISRRIPLTQDYLPVGVSAPGDCTWQVAGLLTVPEITVEDETGRQLPVTYDPDSHSFTVEPPHQEIGGEERETALKAVRTYALYMIKRAGAGELAKYFNRSSDTYRAITGAQLSFVQDAARREFVEESVTDYCRYTEDLFSVRVSLNLKLYRSDGSVKENPMDQTLFFSREPGGKWLCYAMTAVDVSANREQLRLTFCQGDRILLSAFFDADTGMIQCPQPDVPAGKTFSGWVVEETDGEGKEALRLVFEPDGEGNVPIPGNMTLMPMTLYPLFE